MESDKAELSPSVWAAVGELVLYVDRAFGNLGNYPFIRAISACVSSDFPGMSPDGLTIFSPSIMRKGHIAADLFACWRTINVDGYHLLLLGLHRTGHAHRRAPQAGARRRTAKELADDGKVEVSWPNIFSILLAIYLRMT